MSSRSRLLIFSQGNPRDFLILFRHAYLSFYDSSAKRIDAEHVEAGAKAFGIEKLDNINHNGGAQRLLERIIAFVLHTHEEGAFIVHTQFASDPSLQHLVHDRILHVWDRSYSSPNISGQRFMLLALDFCIIAEHLSSPKYRGIWELPLSVEDLERETAQERSELSAKLLSTERPDKRVVRYISFDKFEVAPLSDSLHQTQHAAAKCGTCGAHYDSQHPVVLKFRACSNCAAPLDLPDAG